MLFLSKLIYVVCIHSCFSLFITFFSTQLIGFLYIYDYTYYQWEAWLRFDLTSIPSNAILNSASLSLSPCRNSTCGYNYTCYAVATFQLDICTNNSWTESSITTVNAPYASCSRASLNASVPSCAGGNAMIYTPPWTLNMTTLSARFQTSKLWTFRVSNFGYDGYGNYEG